MTTSGRIQVLRAADRPATPWLNGGGVTREVAGSPAGAGPTAFDWRVSLADVASAGPFSEFPGIDRVITLVDGDGMALTVDGTAHRIDAPFRPFAFPGDAATDCRLLGGPVVDFNVMTRRGRTTAGLVLATEAAPVDVPAGATVLVLCLTGSATLAGTALARFDAALLDGGSPDGPDRHESPGPYELRPDGVTAVVTFGPAA
ncbi:HutD family protein [Kitasatospora sp. NBC_01560]|uniref:HutD/Ves family protein n=1 Tax=Kitasatospora sp. NBC_01560 TaxID=2975965 RepID=UPI00386CE677